MMKRILSLALCLLMLGTAMSHAESDPYTLLKDALYRIVLRTEEGDTTLGSGVVFMQDNILLTAAGCCREGDLFAIGEDGEHRVVLCAPAGETGAALVELATSSAATPLALANYDKKSLPYIFGCDAKGNMGAAPLYQVLFAMYRGQNALTLSGEEGVLPGGIMADEQGNIIGLVVSQQMEGLGMYTALEPDSLYLALSGGGDASAFLPLEVTWDEGLLTLTWTDETRTDGAYLLTLTTEENRYYTSYELLPGEREALLAVSPGHTYYMQLQWVDVGSEAQDMLWSAMTAYTVPETAFTQYGFQQSCYLASAPAGQEVTEALAELSPVTTTALTDEGSDLYLQVFNTYDVDGEITLPMTVALTAPDGQLYFEEMSYIFSPEYETDDVFAVPVDDLFAACRSFSGYGTMPEGEYTLCYTIGGWVAGEYTFTVGDGQ